MIGWMLVEWSHHSIHFGWGLIILIVLTGIAFTGKKLF